MSGGQGTILSRKIRTGTSRSGGSSPIWRTTGRFTADVPYGEGEANKFDLYLPKDDTKDAYGLAVYLHAGGFTTGDKSGVAERYRLPGAAGTVGLIRPLSRCFCGRCSRIRLTADGCLKPCLHSREEIPIRGLHGEALRRELEKAILHKPERHGELSARLRSEADRDMNQIGG